MTTSYSNRIKPVDTYVGRQKPTTDYTGRWKQYGNTYFLQDINNNFITDIFGDFILVGWDAYIQNTPYSLRVKP